MVKVRVHHHASEVGTVPGSWPYLWIPGMKVTVSTSPGYACIVAKWSTGNLHIHNTQTGELLASAPSENDVLRLTPDGHGVWCGKVDSWKIDNDRESNIAKLEQLRLTKDVPIVFSWWPPCHKLKIGCLGSHKFVTRFMT